jgi:hypothetical protein
MVAVSLTAHGLGVWEILTSFLLNRGALDFIAEWAAPDLLSIAVAPYVLVLVALMVALARNRLGVRDLWVVIPFLVFGLTSARAVMPAAIVLVPFAASVWPSEMGAAARIPSPGPARINLVIAGLLVLAPLAVVAGFEGIDEKRFPVQAATSLSSQRVWHDDATGGYLIYAGRLPVFIDDRAELYGEEFFRDFVATRRGVPDWQSVFDDYHIEQALVSSEAGLAAAMTDEGWPVQYSDDRWTVFSRP